MNDCDFFVYESEKVEKLLLLFFFNKNYLDECVQSVAQLYTEYMFTALCKYLAVQFVFWKYISFMFGLVTFHPPNA